MSRFPEIVRGSCQCPRMNNETSRFLPRWLSDPDGWDEDDLLWDDDDTGPPPPLPPSPAQQAALATAIDDGLRAHGCDNTLRAAQSWTTRAGLDWNGVHAGLQGRGGFCDCEVLFNVGLATS